MNQPTAPVNLAVFRIAVFSMLSMFHETAWFATLPPALLFPPSGWQTIAPHLLIGAESANALAAVFRIATLCAALGLATRISTALSALLAVYFVGLPQMFGKIDHLHHLVWFAALLACAPSGAALSIDALLRRRGTAPEAVSAFPLRCAWILIGFMYFFPGLAKLRFRLYDWVFGDDMKYHLHDTWNQWGPEYTPLFRIDEWPLLYRTGGLFTIVFELSFVFLLFSRRWRPLALAAGLGFHIATFVLTGINFWTLVVCYVVFVDWGPLFRWRMPAPPVEVRPTRASLVMGTILLAGNFWCGLLLIDNWPFAVYPTFAHETRPARTTLELELIDRNGRALPHDLSRTIAPRFGSARTVRLLIRTANAPPAEQRKLVEALLELLRRAGVPVQQATLIRVYRNEISTDPERRHAPLIRREKIAELRIGG